MSAKRHLKVVDTTTGEQFDACPNCAELERDLARKRSQLASLRADHDAKARSNTHWPDALVCFQYWQRKCGHERSQWDWRRFELVLPFLETDGPRECCIAILGAAYDGFQRKRKNGTWRRFDEWERIFKDRGNFDEYRAKAPLR